MRNKHKNGKQILFLLLVLAFTMPTVKGFTIDGPTNFESSHGGIVRFDPTLTSRQCSINGNNLIQFTRFTLTGTNYGIMAFDAGAGVNMTILSVTDRTVVYNVSCAGVGTTYVLYNSMGDEPRGTNTDNVVYNDATGIATVTTTGNVVVTLTYHNISNLIVRNFSYYIDFLPIIFLLISLQLRREGIIGNRMLAYALVMAAVGLIIAAIRAMGY